MTKRTLEALRGWFDGKDGLREFLAEHAPDRVELLDAGLKRIETLEALRKDPLPVCFLGGAGVGKSTLLNAVVGGTRSLLPAGGVGPLTALATRVAFAEKPFFEARYHGKDKVNQVLFALERAFTSDGAAATKDNGEGDPASAGAGTEKRNAYTQLAALLIRGDQFKNQDVSYLMDGLRRVLGAEPRWNATLEPEDLRRIERLAEVLASPDRTRRIELTPGAEAAFYRELHEHAAGALAPVIRELEVGYNSPILKSGLILVDLPGVGVANDEYQEVTAEWIRKARAVVLVVDRAGFTKASADLLKETTFLNSLLHDSPDEPDSARLVVVATKLDQPAAEERQRLKDLDPGSAQPFLHYFEDVCRRAVEVMRNQVETQLVSFVEDGALATRDARDEVVKRVVAGLSVYPLSATEYRALLLEDDDVPRRLKRIEESGIPAFQESLRAMAASRFDKFEARISTQEGLWLSQARTAVEMVVAKWEEDNRAEEEAQRLKQELEEFSSSLRTELANREGAFRNFLSETMPSMIEAELERAAQEAEKAIRARLRKYRNFNYRTLQAAIKRGGTFHGAKKVEIPVEITLEFEEPLAVVWSKKLLVELRRRTKEMGENHVQLVEPIVGWARNQGARVKPRMVEALHEDLKTGTAALGQVGKEAIDELKEAVKLELYKQVEKAVRSRCQAFVKSGEAEGAGVLSRMIEFLDDNLGPSVVEAAKPKAKEVLLHNYEKVRDDIRAVFRQRANPIQLAVGALVDSHEEHVRRSDAQRRKVVLARGHKILDACPKGSA
ncbi:dynamin family protein [Archangium violaceum]|uniref:dynamin family protein n=1 Tax=Archangium violaceum TaxID=83451 RepID=UPI00193BCEA1|nr:dynamin family protein [Archangium violaceum]QRK06705.1 dynamin family protein [Archangium violaceum]